MNMRSALGSKLLLGWLFLTFGWWMPTVWAATVASDTFTEAVNGALSAHTPDTGTGWSVSNAAMVVDAANDIAESSSNVGGTYYFASEGTTLGDDDMDVSVNAATATNNGRRAGPSGRIPSGETGAANCYWAEIQGDSTVTLNNIIASSASVLGSYAHSSNDALLKLEIRTAAKKVYVDGAEQISSADDNLTGNNFAGVVFRNRTDNSVDNFLSESVAAGAARRVWHISQLVEWLDRWLIREVQADATDIRPLGYYLSPVCGTGFERQVGEDLFEPDPRRPCLVETAGFTDWVLLWDGGTTMLFKALADQARHDGTATTDRVGRGALETNKLPLAARRYLAQRGEGTIRQR